MTQSRAPIVIAILFLVSMLYVGSYLALVDPPDLQKFSRRIWNDRSLNYRFGGKWVDSFYWPLEQLDRKVRPGKWNILRSVPNPIINSKSFPVHP